jgi:(p)ppGpp synthase/HD superfamily hydrolase
MSTLSRAIAIAVEAHDGVVDKAGAPYILHPLRVMLGMSSEDERIAAVLHDVVEDCRPVWNFERLEAEGFKPGIMAALRAVTKLPEEEDKPGDGADAKLDNYLKFIRRAAADPIGRTVKRADLEDNCNLSRIPNPGPKDHARVAKYRVAIALLDYLA